MTVSIQFEPWVAPDGQVQNMADEVLAADETVQFDGPWLHVVKVKELAGGVEYLAARSYPVHGIRAVLWVDPA